MQTLPGTSHFNGCLGKLHVGGIVPRAPCVGPLQMDPMFVEPEDERLGGIEFEEDFPESRAGLIELDEECLGTQMNECRVVGFEELLGEERSETPHWINRPI